MPGVVPLGVSDGQERRLDAISDSDDRRVDLVAGAGLGIMDDAVSDTGGQTAQKLGVGMVQGPVAADLFEMEPEHVADETPRPACETRVALPGHSS